MTASVIMDDDDVTLRERSRLFVCLKSTVEGLLVSQSTNVWNTYGGLTRLSKIVHDILGHRTHAQQGINDYWQFIAGIRVLAPTLTRELERQRLLAEGHPSGRSFAWVQARLQEHSLTKYLAIVSGDCEHLRAHYQESAFLRQDDYCRALFVCLEAVENNELTILTRLDPALIFVHDRRTRAAIKRAKGHVRSPSLPDNMASCSQPQLRGDREVILRRSSAEVAIRRRNPSDKSKKEFHRSVLITPRDRTGVRWSHSAANRDAKGNEDADSIINRQKLKYSQSEPSIGTGRAVEVFDARLHRSHGDVSATNGSVVINTRNATDCAVQGAASSVEQTDSESTASNYQRSPSHTYHHVRSKSDVSVKSHVDCGTTATSHMPIPMSSSLPSFLPEEQILDSDRLSTHQEMTTAIFRRPMKGQSLTSFLSSQDFRTCADLDKENAHFSICEALIAAIEQIRCNQTLRVAEEEDADSDDDEIKSLKQRIRIRRRERIQEKTFFKSSQLLSDGRTDTPTTTTSQSPSPRSTSSDKSDGNTSDSVDPIDLSDVDETDSTLGALEESGLSLSLASLYSKGDLGRMPTATPQQTSQQPNDSFERSRTTISVSAESVALSLIRKFSEKQLPKASDLDWLVSEQDAPQKLLPLPSSWPISPDDAEDVAPCQQTRLRGNFEWAPPRPQIIFNVHAAPQRKIIIAKQNYRCAGCGTKIDTGFLKRLSYCEYLGKYFCQCCHNGSLACIPARVLRKWDFDKYVVSNFSKDLLEKIFSDPLYDVDQLNPSLYRRVKALSQVLQCRLQLYHIKDFVRACRKCDSLARDFDEQIPAHLLNSPHLYSMHNLLQVKSGEMLTNLKQLLARSLSHVVVCELCQARGFFCEFCNNKNTNEVIFPFQLDKVVQCAGCRSWHHTLCFVPNECPKCVRIELRQVIAVVPNHALRS